MTVSGVLWGAFVNPQDMSTLRLWEARVGRKTSLAHHAQGWANGKNADGTPRYASLPSALINQHWAEGRLVMLDWGSWNLSDRSNPDFNLPQIAASKHDVFLHSFARQCAALKHSLYLRFDGEMNGNGSWNQAWTEGVLGNGAGDYVRAWQHVHDIFVAEGATNVSWVWCPNVLDSTNAAKVGSFYPGPAFVDVVGLDTYNKAGQDGSTWLTFKQTMTGYGTWLANSWDILRSIAAGKPMALCEFGCDDRGGDKLVWLTDAFRRIPLDFPDLVAVSYFDWNPSANTHWSIDFPAGSAAAIRAGLDSSPAYLDGGRFLMPADGQPVPRYAIAGPDQTPSLTAQLNAATATITENVRAITAARDLHTVDAQSLADLAGQLDAANEATAVARATVARVASHIRGMMDAASSS